MHDGDGISPSWLESLGVTDPSCCVVMSAAKPCDCSKPSLTPLCPLWSVGSDSACEPNSSKSQDGSPLGGSVASCRPHQAILAMWQMPLRVASARSAKARHVGSVV